MTRRIALVSCASKKSGNASPAEALYVSDLFRKAGALASQRFDAWYILSAKHGLLEPGRHIEPYDETLNRLSVDARMRWASQVSQEIHAVLAGGDQIYFFAGQRYREFVEPTLRESGFAVYAPLSGLSIGRQLQWLNVQLQDRHRIADLDRFYDLLKLLTASEGGGRIMGESSGKMRWPSRGLYFFFEPEERRFLDPQTCRVVRVGTHGVSEGSKSTLWGRLRTHRGAADKGGNHRGSIFRLHVGAALQASGQAAGLNSWGMGQSAKKEIRSIETDLEQAVSTYLGGMAIVCLGVADEPSAKSDRAYLERNSLGLLVGPTGPIDLPSENWLGRFSASPEIRYSGLWNKDFITFQYDRRFLDVLEQYVHVMLGERSVPAKPLAPEGWYLRNPSTSGTTQMSFLFNDASQD